MKYLSFAPILSVCAFLFWASSLSQSLEPLLAYQHSLGNFEGTNAQDTSGLTFFPVEPGNVWQYRYATTNEVVYTRYNDSLTTDSAGNIFVKGRRIPGGPLHERIDTNSYLYNLNFQASYPRYKLNGELGESWQAGVLGSNPVLVTVFTVFQDFVFSQWTTIKGYRFEVVPPPPQPRTYIGDDYLAEGFGLIQTLPASSDPLYLAGALIDSVYWGLLVDVREFKELIFRQHASLHQNYPNPFNPITIIEYELPVASNVRLTLFDVLGRVLSVVEDGYRAAGYHSIRVNGTELASGVILYRLEAGNFAQTKRMLLIK